MKRSIYIGYEAREAEAFAVARRSLRKHAPGVPVFAICLDEVRRMGLYRRPTRVKDGRLFDDISEHPMATSFAISRFLTPHLAGDEGWALFVDCDVLARAPLRDLFDSADPKKAVMCVKHDHAPKDGIKMDGQVQSRYNRKNWSSVCLWNLAHPANKKLTVEAVNSLPGRDLHAFAWLKDSQIGSLSPEWNYLVGHTRLDDGKVPKLVHFTEGFPSMPGYEDAEFADEWRSVRQAWLDEEFAVVGRPSTWERPAYTNGADVNANQRAT